MRNLSQNLRLFNIRNSRKDPKAFSGNRPSVPRSLPAAVLAVILAGSCLISGCGAGAKPSSPPAESASASEEGQAAGDNNAAPAPSEKETAPTVALSSEGLSPLYGNDIQDGEYPIQVDCSSSMFPIDSCTLSVRDGNMEAVLTMGGTGYLYVYPGTEEQAQAAPESDRIPYQEDGSGACTFTIPVEALDKPLDCAAFSRRKELWYGRTLLFRSASLPPEAFRETKLTTAEDLGLKDGTYHAAVTLGGGSGRASVQSPATLRAEGGKLYATVIWGSANYDYMKADGQRFDRINEEGNSTFEIPISGFDWKLPVIADTIAMGSPHEIEYTLYFDSSTLEEGPAGDGSAPDAQKKETSDAGSPAVRAAQKANSSGKGSPVSRATRKNDTSDAGSPAASAASKGTGTADANSPQQLPLSYADQFSVDLYPDGCRLIQIQGGRRYLVVPEDVPVPQNLSGDMTVIRQPLKNIYLIATAAMDLFRSLDGLDQIRLSGTAAEDWSIQEARAAMERGDILFAGKYNAPDYELILSEKCDLAIESTMVYHSPEVKEQLEKLSIPVLVEHSSYESHPLGRMEWVKLYGVLLGKEDLAESVFEKQMARLEPILNQPSTQKTVAFFYLSPDGSVSVRRTGDYLAKTVELAGGRYIPRDNGTGGSGSTFHMQMEAFYAAAKDADYLIYNSTIYGELKDLNDLLAKSALLQDFKAVKEGHVWCTEDNFFQETLGLGDMILDIHTMLTQEDAGADDMTYLFPLT